jgi:hypothetical protein
VAQGVGPEFNPQYWKKKKLCKDTQELSIAGSWFKSAQAKVSETLSQKQSSYGGVYF